MVEFEEDADRQTDIWFEAEDFTFKKHQWCYDGSPPNNQMKRSFPCVK